MTDKITYHRYVPIHRVRAYGELGWIPDRSDQPLHAPHGLYSIIMTFDGEGEPVEPEPEMIGGEE